jgi:hypothetical protein
VTTPGPDRSRPSGLGRPQVPVGYGPSPQASGIWLNVRGCQRCQPVPRGGPQKPHKPLRRKAHHWKPTDGTGLNSTRRHSGYDGGISLLTSPYGGELGCVIVTRSWPQRGIEPLKSGRSAVRPRP